MKPRTPLPPGTYSVEAKDFVFDKSGRPTLAPNAKPIPSAPYKPKPPLKHLPPKMSTKSFSPDLRSTIDRPVPRLDSKIPCVDWSPKEGVLYVFVPETFKIIAVPADSGIELRTSKVGLTLDIVPHRVAPTPTLTIPKKRSP